MDDKPQPQDSSLKGRGRDIMRGPSSEQDSNTSSDAGQSGSWLPPTQDEDDNNAFFESDDEVLQWMEADPERNTPTIVPGEDLLQQAAQPTDEGLFDEPDFDAFFGEQPPHDSSDDAPTEEVSSDIVQQAQAPAAQPSATETQTLDDIFASQEEQAPAPESPHFDDIFANIPGKSELLPKATDFDELPLPETGELYDEEDIPGFASRGQAISPMLDSLEGETDEIPSETVHDAEDAVSADRAPAGFTPDDSWIDTDQPLDTEAIVSEDIYDEMPSIEATEALLEQGETDPSEALWQESTQDEEVEATFALPTLDELPAGFVDPSAAFDAEAMDEEPQEDFAMPSMESLPPEPEPEVLAEYEDEPDPDTMVMPVMEDLPDDYEDPSSAFDAVHENIRAMADELDDEAEQFIAMLEAEEAESAQSALPPTDLPEESIEPVDDFNIDDVEASEPMVANIVEKEPADTPFGLDIADETPSSSYSPSRLSSVEAEPLAEVGDTEPIDLRKERVSGAFWGQLTPQEPEELPASQRRFGDYPVEGDDVDGADYSAQSFDHLMDEAGADLESIGGGTASETTRGGIVPLPVATSGSGKVRQPESPFGERRQRKSARDIFQPSEVTSDKELLEVFVDDARMRDVFEQIEALQEEIVENVRGERGNSDVYQEELLQASNMLLQSRENYDEARAIVYRIRADLKREQRVENEISKFRPLITNIYIGMGILAVVLALLGQLFISVAENVGVEWIGQGYYPALAGAIGALLFGYRTLNKHTTILRDFDASHVNWYIINPILGLLSGFLLYLFLLSTAVTTLDNSSFEVTGSQPVTLIVAVAVGYNQNIVIRLLDATRQRVAPDDGDDDPRPER